MKNGDFQPTNFASTGAGIQAAIDYCGSSGGKVFLGPGTFTLTSSLSVPYDAIEISGSGLGVTTIKIGNSMNASGIVFSKSGGTSAVSNVAITNLTVDGNKANNTTNSQCVAFQYVTGAIADSVETINSTDIGFGCGNGAIGASTSKDVTFLSCRSHGNKGNGFDINNCAGVSVIGCHSYSNGTASIQAIGIYTGEFYDSNVIIKGNIAYSNTSHGIGYNANTAGTNIPAHFVVISGNICYSNSLAGIGISGASGFGNVAGYFNLSDNLCYSNGTDATAAAVNRAGIYVDYVTRGVIANNQCFNGPGATSQQYGLSMSHGASWTLVGNQLWGNTTGEATILSPSSQDMLANGTQANQLTSGLSITGTLATTGGITSGSTITSSGEIYLPNSISIQARNAAGSAWHELLRNTNVDNTLLVANQSLQVFAGGTERFTIGNTGGISLGNGATPILKHLSGTATLDFDLSAAVSQDLTVTVTGAALGDTVSVGVPNGSVPADTAFFGWVSSANVVTVRAYRLAGTPNPASGSFRVDVWQH